MNIEEFVKAPPPREPDPARLRQYCYTLLEGLAVTRAEELRNEKGWSAAACEHTAYLEIYWALLNKLPTEEKG